MRALRITHRRLRPLLGRTLRLSRAFRVVFRTLAPQDPLSSVPATVTAAVLRTARRS